MPPADVRGGTGGAFIGGREQTFSHEPPLLLPFPKPRDRGRHLSCSLRPGPPLTSHRAPTFGVEVHAQPGSSTLGFKGLQVFPDKHILHLIKNGQDGPTRWTQRKPMLGQGVPPYVDGAPPHPSTAARVSVCVCHWLHVTVRSGYEKVRENLGVGATHRQR